MVGLGRSWPTKPTVETMTTGGEVRIKKNHPATLPPPLQGGPPKQMALDPLARNTNSFLRPCYKHRWKT